MLSEKEINISNISYTNKDFASIYPELVDFIRNITNRWDPKTSNESDPGVVLTKENAFIGDKLNYNVDKNILEAFMPSATQETSMRQNCESRGYDMSYYNAAETTLTFVYNGLELEDTQSVILPMYDTKVTSSDDKITYVVVNKNVEFLKDNLVVTVPAMEGEIEILTVASLQDEYKVQLNNLDDNNRIFFPVSNVAQNGVFISTDSHATWDKVENLNVVQSGNPVYKFGYSSEKGLPYVEFPSDIASLIDSGLTIRYIVTSGKDGNVQANYLTKLSAYKVDKPDDLDYNPTTEGDSPNLYINNESASINGEDPQTINEAYEDYKRTIGVFDTLVTCRDYASAIYNMYLDENALVSNVQVSDRRDDINYGVRYISFDGQNSCYENYAPSSPSITPYDLCLYPLNKITNYSLEDYNNSFNKSSAKDLKNITDELEISKCVSHNYKELANDDIYAIENIANLDAKIVTTYKVNNYERAQIIENVKQALIENFNARKVSYGYEIPYDTILKVIQEADARISFVSLAEPELSTEFLLGDGSHITSSDDTWASKYFPRVIARNILEGKVSLFDFNFNFNYDFGQTNVGILNELKTISSEVKIKPGTSYKLDKNEVIQLVGPNLATDISYVAYTSYAWVTTTTNDASYVANTTTIKAGSNYKLQPNDRLIIRYVDSDKVTHVIKYGKDDLVDTIIQPTFNLEGTEQESGGGRKEYDGIYYNQVGTNDTIDIKKEKTTTLNKVQNCYWLRNNEDNALFTSDDLEDDTYKIILGDDEYFFYTDTNYTTLVTAGSGTTLTTQMTPSEINNYWEADRVDIKDILEKGLLALKNFWKKINFNETNGVLTLQENKIITLTEGDEIKFSSTPTPSEIDNTLRELELDANDTCSYVIGGNEEQLEKYDIQDMYWSIRSRLDINASKDKYQTLVSDESGGIYTHKQSMTFTNKDDTPLSLSSGDSFYLNLATNLAGGSSVNVTTLDATNEEKYPLSVYKFILDTNNAIPERDANGMWTLKYESSDSKTISVPTLTNKNLFMTIYLPQSGTTFTLSSGTGVINDYRYNASVSQITTQGTYSLYLTSSCTNITIASNGKGNIILGTPNFFSGYDSYNPQLGIDKIHELCPNVSEATILTSVRDVINQSINDNSFYYGMPIENSKAIEVDDLSSSYAFYDYNNVANKFTITKINLDEPTTIDVVRSSRL